MPDMQIHYEDEWAALYVDGKLDRVGDARNTEERAFELLGVTIVQDDAFMRGQTSRDGVARTLADVDAYADTRDAALREAARKIEQAKALLAEANRLDPTGRIDHTVR
jgi:hypothetical protein